MELLILNYFSNAVHTDKTSLLDWKAARNAYLFILAETYANKPKYSKYSNWLKAQVLVPSITTLSRSAILPFSAIQSVYYHSIREAFPLTFYPIFFALLLRGFDTPLVTIQNYFYSAITTIITTHSDLFLNQNVLTAMKRGMVSTYISVREKNMKLLLAATAKYPRLLITYYHVVLKGLKDRGISVRKVSYQLLRRLIQLLVNDSHVLSDEKECSIAEEVFDLAIQCLLKEEDKTVRSLAYEIVCHCLSQGLQDDPAFTYLSHICYAFQTTLQERLNENTDKITSSVMILKELHELMPIEDITKQIHWILETRIEKQTVGVSSHSFIRFLQSSF